MSKVKLGKVLGTIEEHDLDIDPLVFFKIKEFVLESKKHGNCTIRMDRTGDDFVNNRFTIVGYFFSEH